MSAFDSAEEVDLTATATVSRRDATLSEDHRPYHQSHRSYSTIGIGDHAFLVPPTHRLPGEYFLTGGPPDNFHGDDGGETEQQNGGAPAILDGTKTSKSETTTTPWTFVSDEMVGGIKASPCDFVVREIAPAHRCATTEDFALDRSAHHGVLPCDRIADLSDRGDARVDDAAHDASSSNEYHASIQRMEEPLPSKRSQNRIRSMDSTEPSCDEHAGGVNKETTVAPEPTFNAVDAVSPSTFGKSTSASCTSSSSKHLAAIDPLTALKRQLDHTLEGSDEWIRRLLMMFESVVDGLRHEAGGGTSGDGVAESPSTLKHVLSFRLLSRRPEGDSSEGLPLDRGIFHQSIRSAFPMLVAESTMNLSTEGSRQGHDERCNIGNERGVAVDSAGASYRVTVTPDPLFLSLAPLLHEPHVDLPRLYAYYKGSSKVGETNSCREDPPVAVLRLKPGLPRTERRHVHHTIETKSNQNLVTVTRKTTTEPQGPADPGASHDRVAMEATVATIVVQWSKVAQRRLAKRISNQSRKRHRQAPTGDSQFAQNAPPSDHGDREPSSSGGGNPHSLFVLKKTGIEHLRAQQCLADLLKCRQADLGLAGIKDTVATTYQFCTVRNYDAARLVRSLQQRPLRNYGTPGSGIQVGNVRAVNWLLNKGDLDGNRFEIILRDVRRVHVGFDPSDGSVREWFVPCQIDHVASRIDTVVKSGFCNFYGEQRVGIPGMTSDVGIRGFDVGRSMLQQSFSDAVDKIMTGRIITRDYDNREPENVLKVRQTWKETGGDPHRSWKALPRGSSMARERLILKGLKRYGDPLLALRCLHFHERMFWISAYQSYVWNTMTSERIRRYGTSVVIGDLIENGNDGQVEIVTSEALQRRGLRFEDVVLPLPGYDVLYPTNEIGGQYRSFLEREGISFCKDAPPESTSKGSYRRLVSRAYNVSFEPVTASSPEKASNLDIKLRFDLPTGSYATMFLRELMFTTVVRDRRNVESAGDE